MIKNSKIFSKTLQIYENKTPKNIIQIDLKLRNKNFEKNKKKQVIK